MVNRKRTSCVPQQEIAPAAKKVFISGSIHSALDASDVHRSMDTSLSVSENSPPNTPQGTNAECNMGYEEGRVSDSSDDSDDSICTVDSGVEIDVAITPRKLATFLKHKLPEVHSKSPDSMKTEEKSMEEDGFVRRMANLNARARVAVFFQHGKYNKRSRLLPIPAGVIAETSANKSVQGMAKRNSVNVSSAHFDMRTYAIPCSCEYVPCNVSVETVAVCGSSTNCTSSAEAVDSGNTTQNEDTFYNNLGLLYDGRTVHPHLRIFLQQGVLPSRIMPLIVPAAISFVYDGVRQITNQETVPGSLAVRKARRGDNGWCCYGEPIKVMQYRDENNKLRTRKYYIGVKRKEEVIFVRNCICAKSGTPKPFVAKVASIWQENGGIMMTLFWYYRGDEVDHLGSSFVEGELLASQHHDDNTVACVEDKCYVLGLSEYCRYKTSQKRREDSSCLPNTSISVPNCHASGDHSIHQHWLPTADTDPQLVFLCYQGYNHFAGKLLG